MMPCYNPPPPPAPARYMHISSCCRDVNTPEMPVFPSNLVCCGEADKSILVKSILILLLCLVLLREPALQVRSYTCLVTDTLPTNHFLVVLMMTHVICQSGLGVEHLFLTDHTALVWHARIHCPCPQVIQIPRWTVGQLWQWPTKPG